MEDGLYIGLPEKQYRSDPALSQSGIKVLLTDPEEYWYQAISGEYQQEQKDHLDTGIMWHKRLLEPEAFAASYEPAPWITDKSLRPLDTVDDLKAFLEGAGAEFKKTARKAELQEAARAIGGLVMDDYMNREGPCKLIYSPAVWNDMLAAEAAVRGHPYFGQMISGGLPEVSIFWTDESGVRLKARIDYLKPHGIIDYKTISNDRGKALRAAALQAIKWEKYDLQAAMYTIACGHAVGFVKEGKVHGDLPGWFADEFVKEAEKPFGFLFQKSRAPFTVRGLSVRRRGNDAFNVFGSGLYHMQNGIELYREYSARYGEKRWLNTEGMTEVEDHEIWYG